MSRTRKLTLTGITLFVLLSAGLALAVPSLPWFDFKDEKLNQQSNGAVQNLDSGLAAFFEMMRVSRGSGSNDAKKKDFETQQGRARDALDASAKEFSTLAESLPERKFNVAPLERRDARTFLDLREQFDQLGLGYPENTRAYFKAIAALVTRLSKDLQLLQLGVMDRNLFARIIQSKILLERVGASTHVVALAMN